jgi:hypothetical protein
VEELRRVFARSPFSKIEELRANSLSAMVTFDKEFIDPGTFAAIFQTEIEADHKICDGCGGSAREIDQTESGIGE